MEFLLIFDSENTGSEPLVPVNKGQSMAARKLML